ncbi:MAG: ribosomal protection-like ABC-F family protein [Pirellulaceae bacterium]
MRKYFSAEPVLDGASLEIRKGQHIGLVGPNGCGKTTLLNILVGELSPDGGDVAIAPGARIGFLRQQVEFDLQQTVWQMAETALAPLIQLADKAHQLADRMAEASTAEQKTLARQYDFLHSELEQRGGYQIDHKIRRVLSGLGFGTDYEQRPIGQLSGGQQNRLMLARLLLEEPDLMLLDEPSNHLDIESTTWLEQFLAESRQAFLLVSHDRYFLDRVTDITLELINGEIDSFPGNYTKYKELKSERLEVQRRTYERQQEEKEKLKDFIRRHHHGQKHAQAEDRRRKLERLEQNEQAPVPREIPIPKMKFHDVDRCGDVVLRVENLAKSFDELLFSRATFQIERGQRWGLLGANGSGKTTLLRCLLDQLPADEGTVKLGTGVEVGYFDQHLQCVDSESISAEAIRPRDETTAELRMDELARRDLLARFGIVGDTALQKVHSLSGGQRNRVALANLAAQRSNFLILDEPTNHLDLWAREALEHALNQFAGTVLLVSHDRYFLNRVCTHLLVLENRITRVIEGNYDTYRMLLAGDNGDRETDDSAGQGTVRKKRKPRSQNSEAAKRKRRFPYRKVPEIEADIAACEAKIEELHFRLADPAIHRDADAVIAAKSELADQSEQLQQLYEHWEEASELN